MQHNFVLARDRKGCWHVLRGPADKLIRHRETMRELRLSKTQSQYDIVMTAKGASVQRLRPAPEPRKLEPHRPVVPASVEGPPATESKPTVAPAASPAFRKPFGKKAPPKHD